MGNTSIDLDGARAILKTYHQVHDAPNGHNRLMRSTLVRKNQELEQELNLLKDKYMVIQQELSNREERLARLSRQLIDRTAHFTQLQEDFENAIEQMTRRKEVQSNE